MFMDDANFPIVRLHYDQVPDREENDVFVVFEALLDRNTPFVIIGQSGSADDAEHEHDPAERKRMALWSKKNKPRLRTLVKAMIHVEPSTAKRLGMKAFQVMSEKFWGYPMLLAASEMEALEKAMTLLDGASNMTSSGKGGT